MKDINRTLGDGAKITGYFTEYRAGGGAYEVTGTIQTIGINASIKWYSTIVVPSSS
jgi:hypothetical protein